MIKQISATAFVNYFTKTSLLESVLIKFTYDPQRNSVELVTDLINFELPSGQREFQKLIFGGVTSYKRNSIKADHYSKCPNSYSTQHYEGVIVVQEVKISPVNLDSYRLLLGMDYNFGSVEFEFKELKEQKRTGIGQPINESEWIYIDIETNKKFLFDNPFG